jgi:glycolate oxidase FAD binding subunit
MAGPVEPADVRVTTTGLRRVLEYEPRDLTISVEAGLPWADLTRMLAQNRQMLPLDPPFAEEGTVGGVVAANLSGGRRRLYGTARDFIIGMKFATVEGRLVQSGGMVVKNVAGLDMAKLMVGSFGTLAAIAVVNFKLVPLPPATRMFVQAFQTAAESVAARDRLLNSVLQPAAIDLLNPPAAARLGLDGYALCVGAGGSPAALDRYEVAQPSGCEGCERRLQEFTPHFLRDQPAGAVARVSCALSQVGAVLESTEAPALARAGSGVCYLHFDRVEPALDWMERTAARGWKAVIEYAPPERKGSLEQWPRPGPDLELMRRIKNLFDPRGVLNRGRLYGRI